MGRLSNGSEKFIEKEINKANSGKMLNIGELGK